MLHCIATNSPTQLPPIFFCAPRFQPGGKQPTIFFNAARLTRPGTQQTWNSSTFYDPEYVEFLDDDPNASLEFRKYGVGEGNYSGSSLYGLERKVLHATADEWPRKAGSWGTVQSGPLAGVLRILEQQERDFHQHLLHTRCETTNSILVCDRSPSGSSMLPHLCPT